MNTSLRRAPGIAWAITAGLLYGAVGIGTCPPAFADDSGRRPSAGTDIDSPGADGAGNDSGPRLHGRDHKGTPSGNTDAGGPAGGGAWHPGDPCPWWPVPRPVRPPTPVSGGNNSGLIAAAPVLPAIPVPVFGAQAEPRFDIDALADDAPAVASPVAAAPAAGYPAAAGPLPRPVPRVATAPAAARLPARVTALSPPAAPAPPPQRPAAGVEPEEPVRLGHPDDLRDADLATAVSIALPGLAALLGLTAFGGLVGYRQARAGYVLRAAGAGRFLQ